MELLRKSNHSFKGVAEFDSSQVPNILHLEPPNCWTLPVVTLTGLAIALPNIRNQMADKLLRSVSECLVYAKHVEKSFSSKGDDFLNVVKKATDVIWVEVEHDRKWLSEDLQKLAVERKTTKETLQSLVDIAEQTINEFRKNKKAGILLENPLSWPDNVIAANSVYRISHTILYNYEGVTLQTDEILFEHLCCLMADILGAYLTNLPHVIIRKCYCSAIEERERSVREAACLRGKLKRFWNSFETMTFLLFWEVIEQHPSMRGALAWSSSPRQLVLVYQTMRRWLLLVLVIWMSRALKHMVSYSLFPSKFQLVCKQDK